LPQVIYVSADGNSQTVVIPAGMSVMQGAINHRIAGILAECGGNCMCATCHVYVDPSFLAQLPPPSGNEKAMLSIAAEVPQANSRLSCQIKMTEELDGLLVRIPKKQR